MTPDALYLAADIIQTAGRIALALVLLGITAVAVLIIRAHLAEVRRTLDHATWGDPAELFAKGLSECPHCGKDDCWCDRDGEPTPAEIADALAIRDAEEAWDRLVCAECGRTDCTHGAVALEEAGILGPVKTGRAAF